MAESRLFVTRLLAIDPRDVVGPGVEIEVFSEPRAPTRDEILARAAGAGALVTMPTDRVDGPLLDALPSLRVVANHAVGLDNIDLDAARQRGVWVTHTPDVLTDATAELTFALILAAWRRLREGEATVRAGRWAWSPTMLLGRQLRGATLGVLGYGRIGRAVARIGAAFGMRTLAAGRGPIHAEPPAQPVSFDELLERSDVLSLHCPLTPATRHLIGAAELRRMKPGALLVNTARGPVVDEAALAAALDAGSPAAAALDVYEREPEVHPALLGRQDVVLLPHLGSATVEARRRMAELSLGDAARVLRGEPPLHPVVVGTRRSG